MKEELAELLGAERAANLIALTLLLRAVTKQPSIDKDKLLEDLIKLLPAENQEQSHDLLKSWREVLLANL